MHDDRNTLTHTINSHALERNSRSPDTQSVRGACQREAVG